MLRKLSAVFLLILTSLGFIAGNVNAANEQAKQEVVFADAGWDSVKFHNAVAGFIGTHAYNITPKIISGSTPIIQTALLRGDVDVHMELWTDNVPTFEADMKPASCSTLASTLMMISRAFMFPAILLRVTPSAASRHSLRI